MNMNEKQSDKLASKKKSNYDIDLLLKLNEQMLLIRRFEEKAGQLYGMGKIGGFCHLYIGQEAVVVGINSALKDNDTMVTSYRDHGHMLVCGMDPKGVMAELTGRITGYSKGKGGSMHMFSREKGFFGGHGIVGAQVPIGAGLAFSHKYKNEKSICVTFFGDGAANQGQVYETFNIAALWSLPVLFIIENNLYGMGTSVERSSSTDNFATRGEAFGIENKTVNGMDVLDVREAAIEAINYCRSNQKPFILEVKTYRFRGHSMSDPGKYRTRDEVAEMRKNGPLKALQKLILESGFNENELKVYLSKIPDEILYAYNVYQIEGEGRNLFSKIEGDENTIKKALKKLHKNRLDGCEMYVNLEPCPMCAVAISKVHLSKIYFGAEDEKGGCVINGPKIFSLPNYRSPEIISHCLAEQSSELLKKFFLNKRKTKEAI